MLGMCEKVSWNIGNERNKKQYPVEFVQMALQHQHQPWTTEGNRSVIEF
jgi:hypothetical protein